MIKVLMLAANPTGTTRLKLDEEFRAIDEALHRSKYRDAFSLESQWAVRISDLQELLFRYEPDIIHFCGHGTESSEIILEDETGEPCSVPLSALRDLFNLLKFDIRCVLLSACHSGHQAAAIAEYIDFVIGVPDILHDELSIEFSAAFYRALGYGNSILTSYELAKNQIDIRGFDYCEPPTIYIKEDGKQTHSSASRLSNDSSDLLELGSADSSLEPE